MSPLARWPAPPPACLRRVELGATPRRRRRCKRRGRSRSPIRSTIPAATSSQRGLGSRRNQTSALRLEWPDGVIDLLSPGRLLKVALTSAAAIGDAGLGDSVVGDGVVERDVEGIDNSSDCQLAQFVIDANLLRSGDDEIAVGK